jgi:hypothetical protein
MNLSIDGLSSNKNNVSMQLEQKSVMLAKINEEKLNHYSIDGTSNSPRGSDDGRGKD